jgi:small multidrug resistance family-3 protein
MNQAEVIRSLVYFVVAGLCEIGGGYLVWLWLRGARSVWFALAGAAALVLYGIVPTLQPANFGRVYAAYGGVFVALSLLWGWQVDRIVPDRFDLIGGAIALVGVAVIMYWPRA